MSKPESSLWIPRFTSTLPLTMKTAIKLFRRGYKFLVSSAGLFQSPFDPSDKPGSGHAYHLVKGELTNVKELKVNIHTLATLSLAGLWLFSGCASVEGTADIPRVTTNLLTRIEQVQGEKVASPTVHPGQPYNMGTYNRGL
jgi:hypothetical protein